METISTLWNEFVSEYPIEANTRDTWNAWDDIPDFDRQAVLDGLKIWKASQAWKDDGGKFIPSPANFLRKEIWKQKPYDYQESKPFNPFEEQKPLSQEELFQKRHINSAASYHFYMKAQDQNNYIYEKRK